MNAKRTFTIAVLLLLTTFNAHVAAQTTTVKGRVKDAETGEPMPFVGVKFKGTGIGMTTDAEGFFNISANKPVDSVIAQYTGYEKYVVAVQLGRTQTININLKPADYTMGEVTIEADKDEVNPAHIILDSLWAHEDQNDPKELKAYQHKSYVKTQVFIDNMTEKFRNRPGIRKLQPLFDSMRADIGPDGKFRFPVFISEAASDVYYRTDPERKKEVINGQRIKGIGNLDEGTLISQFTGSSYHDFNFYNERIDILDKGFVSPFARTGKLFYRYMLRDTVWVDNHWCYWIEIVPTRPQDLAFSGQFWVHDTTYAIKQLDLRIGEEANLNFIEQIKINQTHVPTSEGGPWFVKNNRFFVDVAQPGDSAVGMMANIVVHKSDIKVNNPKEPKFFDEPIVTDPRAKYKPDSFWQENIPVKRTREDSLVEAHIDQIENFPVIKTWVEVVETIVTGYYKVGDIDIGPYLLVYGNNAVEGHRFRLGFRTNNGFSDRWRFLGYGAYGTRDDRFKYSGTVEYFIDRPSWTRVGVQYKNDVEPLGWQDNFFASNTLFTASSQVGLIDKMNRVESGRVWFESDIYKGYTQRFFFTVKNYNPAGNFHFAYYDNPGTEDTAISESFTNAEFSVEARFAHREQWLIQESTNTRISIRTRKFPILTIRYDLGLSGVMNSEFDYHRLTLRLKQVLRMGPLGYGKYVLQGSKVFSPLPYPLLNIPPGNETFIRTEATFNMMNFFEFSGDELYTLMYYQYFEGFLLNTIPLTRRLKLRAVAAVKMAYGSYAPENNQYLPRTGRDTEGEPLSQFYRFENGVPYVEVSYGIANIFKFLRIDFIHRLTYLDNDGASPFGVKGGAYFSF